MSIFVRRVAIRNLTSVICCLFFTSSVSAVWTVLDASILLVNLIQLSALQCADHVDLFHLPSPSISVSIRLSHIANRPSLRSTAYARALFLQWLENTIRLARFDSRSTAYRRLLRSHDITHPWPLTR